MTRLEHPTGDTIAQELNGRKPGDSLADVAKDLTDAHAHRPGLFAEDLSKVTQKLHEQGILPGFDLVSVQGQDLVAKDASGKLTLFDATDLNRRHALDTPASSTPIGGRDTTMNADGSGQITVSKGDTAWSISKDVLQKQGVDNPTDNQVANYIKELELVNGKSSLHRLHAGDELKLPASVLAGNKTDFLSDRAKDSLSDKKDEIAKQVSDAQQVIKDLHFDGFDWNANINKDEIATALKRPELTEDQRKSLTFLNDNFDQLKNTGAVLGPVAGLFGRGDSIWMGGLDQYQKDADVAAEVAALHAGL